MRKIISFISFFLLVITQTLFSQSFSLSNHTGVPIISGTTINITGDTGTIICQKIKITNNTLFNKNVKVKKIIIDTLPNTENDFCFGGECHIPSIYITPNNTIIAAGKTDSSFEGNYRPHKVAGTSTILYVFFDSDNVTDSVFVNIAYTAIIPSEIKDDVSNKIEFPAVFPNPVTNYANFSWTIPPNTKTARIVIRDLVGAIVKETIIDSQSGKISVDVKNLQNGLYFYSLLINETPYITRKMIIKH